jgi:hypothetical protein
LGEAEHRIQDATNNQSALLVQVKERLEENNALITASNSIASKVKDALRLQWFHQLRDELKGFMQIIITMNIATYNAVIAIQGSLSGGLERSSGEVLLSHSPELLQHILVGLMAVLVDQQKLDAAETLWKDLVVLFRSKAGENSADSLISVL